MEAGDGRELLGQLPPLPAPDLTRMRREAATGCSLVVGIVAACLGATQIGTSYLEGWWSSEAIWACRSLVFTEALVAIACLLGLMLGDPGVVRRSDRTCLPLPEEVATRLQSGEPLQPMENIVQDGLTYCARCLLWRRPGLHQGCAAQESCECFRSFRRIHHCSTCQRCVENFDHHCGVFGRCIAGRGFGGNMGYFKVIIGVAYLGSGSAATILGIGLFRAGDVGYWVAVVFVGYMSLVILGTLCSVCVWGVGRLLMRHSLWDWPRSRRAGWRGLEPPEGPGSDIDIPPVDAVIIGTRR